MLIQIGLKKSNGDFLINTKIEQNRLLNANVETNVTFTLKLYFRCDLKNNNKPC